MSDDDYPNFGNAWTATSDSTIPTTNASWNPALRPDSHRRNISTASDSDFFDRYPAPTPEKSRSNTYESVREEDEQPDSPSQRHALAAPQNTERLDAEVDEDVNVLEAPVEDHVDNTLSHSRASEVDEQEKVPSEEVEQQDEEAAIFQPGDTAHEQELELEEQMSMEPYQSIQEKAEYERIAPHAGDAATDGTHEQQRPGSGYEHQGETLEMEEAVDEAPSAPLLMDPEAPPTVEDIQRGPTTRAVSGHDLITDFDASSPPSQPLPKTRAHLAHIDRSFTTNFTQIVSSPTTGTEPAQPQHSVDLDWPSVGDDKTFGELLGDEGKNVAQPEPAVAEDPEATQVDDGWGTAAEGDVMSELLGSTRSTFAEPEDMRSIPVQQAEDVVPLEAPVRDPEDRGEEDLAAMWQAALDDDDLLEDSNGLDPSNFFGDDDPGFLEDDLLPDDVGPASAPEPAPTATASARQPPSQRQNSASSYIPATSQQAPQQQLQPSPYGAPGPQRINETHGRSANTPSTGLYDVYGHGASQPQQQPPHSARPAPQTAQSFVDKAKGGYESPFDLPMDVVKPRQRPRQVQQAAQAVPTPPPRSTSMSSQPGLSQGRPATAASGASLSPPSSSSSSIPAAPPPTSANGVPPAKSTPKTDSGFFADLPMTAKPRIRPSGAYTPQSQAAQTPPPVPPAPQRFAPNVATPPSVLSPNRPMQPPVPLQPAILGGLAQPERLPLLPEQPTAATGSRQTDSSPPQNQRYSPSSLPTPAQTQTRFSPAPNQAPPAAAAARYSPAPAAQTKRYAPSATAIPGAVAPPPSAQPSHPFAPRTSSPLAYHDKPQPADPSSPPKPNGVAGMMSPERTGSLSYAPIEQRQPSMGTFSGSPARPQTQSPPAAIKTTRYSAVQQGQRPTSAAPVTAPAPRPSNRLPHRRQFSRDLGFAAPNDERAQDPLERWKGHPIFKWGESGVILSSFPKQTPFYAAGHGIPSIKCTPGSVNVQQASSFLPMDDQTAKFPGPLTARAKGKKKDVLAWMSGKIEDLERRTEVVKMDFQIDADLRKRTEEKLVLWKLMKIFVDHDGHVEGSAKIEDEVRTVLLPNLAQMSQVMELQSPASSTPGVQADPVDRNVIVQLRQALLEGQRERAVWLAEEKKLWGHAMLIASTMGPETWKQIIQAFVRSQVKTVGSDARSLAALYQVFAGNAEECVDELVPPSARAGFQMVSKADGSISGNPLEGLDQWRETLGLVAGNRTPSDGQSLLALGRLLSGYGRAEAAHSCLLFARQMAKHSGADDAEASFVLLGANHHGQNESFANDLDAITLTEIYEWASSLAAPSSAVHYIPHLQPFKLLHAQELAAYGLKSKAQAYCDHITSAYTSTTRPSPYYHPTFTQSVNDLSAFLSQTPQSGPGGLLSKGAMNKVSSGAASWFTKFVSGDDDQASTGSGPGAGSEGMNSGPFGGVNGDSPEFGRSSSANEIYNPIMGGAYGTSTLGTPLTSPPQSFAPSSAPNKYAPMAGGSKYAPVATGTLSGVAQRNMSPQRPSRPTSAKSYAPMPTAQNLNVPRPEAGRAASDYNVPYGDSDSRRSSVQYPGSQGSYEPSPLLAEESAMYSGYQSHIAEQQSPPVQSHDDALARPNSVDMHLQAVPEAGAGFDSPPRGGYEPPSGGYEPPSTGYEPPSYQPYQPDDEPQESDAASTRPKKSIMDDDDDDLAQRAAAMQKAEADRQADEAFKKAAEADAARDKSKGGSGEKKGWLTGWFGGKKDPSMPQTGPIRAKLGEENSFFYDENLKKWVNKKGGSEAATPAAATPPPPKGPPSRAVSGVMGPPSGPPSRVASGVALSSAGARPPTSNMGSPAMGPPSGPPSRAGTPASTDIPAMPASVAALNGGPLPSSAPPSRPSTSMSNASSLDDLLGAPTQRKAGGTLKGKKKGGRYVDVMQAK